MKPLHLILGAAAGLGLLALATSKPSQAASNVPATSPGGRAQIGDEVQLPITSFPGITIPGLPAGAGIVAVSVQRADPDNLGGPIVAVISPGNIQPRTLLPGTIGNFSVPRVAVMAVTRNGVAV